MICIYCGQKTKIVNSRLKKKEFQTWRRHRCLNCQAIVTSVESFNLEAALIVEKRNVKLEPFYRDKLFLSVLKSVDHLPKSVNVANHLTNTVIGHILAPKPLNPVITATNLAGEVIAVLKHYDAAASVRYMSFQSKMKLANDVRRSLK